MTTITSSPEYVPHPEEMHTPLAKRTSLDWTCVIKAVGLPGPGWTQEELAALWTHQMNAQLGLSDGGSLPTYRSLFESKAPSIDWLRQVKRFAKANLGHAESSIPLELARALYVMSLSTAIVRLGVSITTMGVDQLSLQLDWGVRQDWIDTPSRDTIRAAQDAINRPTDVETGQLQNRTET